MILCLNTGSVAKLVVVGSEFQTLTTLSAKNWLRTPLLLSALQSSCYIIVVVSVLEYFWTFQLPFSEWRCGIVEDSVPSLEPGDVLGRFGPELFWLSDATLVDGVIQATIGS